jgi:hypothetical protein
LAEGVPKVVVDGGRLVEEEVAGSGAFVGGVAISLVSRSTSTEEDIEAEASAALDGHRRAWRWSVSVKQVADGRAESTREEVKSEWRTLPLGTGTWIRPLTHVGQRRPAVTGAGVVSAVSMVTAW